MIGMAVTTVLLIMLGSGLTLPILRAILWPGLFLAGLMNNGESDWQASILVPLGNSIFYGAIVLVIKLLAKNH